MAVSSKKRHSMRFSDLAVAHVDTIRDRLPRSFNREVIAEAMVLGGDETAAIRGMVILLGGTPCPAKTITDPPKSS